MEVRNISSKELQINEQIRDKEIRVIDSDGSQLGIMPSKKAMELAEQKNLDLVKIAPQATPPVCKIIDYGKYRFEQSKREKEQRKNQRVVEIKEVRLSLNRFCRSRPSYRRFRPRRFQPCLSLPARRWKGDFRD